MYVKQVDSNKLEWNSTFDVVVAGAGACGLSTAASLIENVNDVLILEKSDIVGGKARVATNQICGINSKYQKSAGIIDSPEKFLQHLKNLQTDSSRKDYKLNEKLIMRVSSHSGSVIDWLNKEIGVKFKLHDSDFSYHDIVRTHYPTDEHGNIPRHGGPIIDKLEQYLNRHDANLLKNTPLDQILIDNRTSNICGIVSKRNPNPEPRQQDNMLIKTDHVVLACDGFGANRDLVLNHFPHLAKFDYWGNRENTGDAVHIAKELDLQLDNPLYDLHSLSTFEDGVYLPNELVKSGIIMINKSGERFMDCGDEAYRILDEKIAEQQDSTAFIVADSIIMQKFQENEITKSQFEYIIDSKIFTKCADIAQICKKFDVSENQLRETIDAINNYRDTGQIRFGRKFGKKLHPPYYVVKIRPMYVKARLGIKINSKFEVLLNSGGSVRGLYAGGNASESLEAGDPNVYTPGMDLMTAYTEGYLIGKSILEHIV